MNTLLLFCLVGLAAAAQAGSSVVTEGVVGVSDATGKVVSTVGASPVVKTNVQYPFYPGVLKTGVQYPVYHLGTTAVQYPVYPGVVKTTGVHYPVYPGVVSPVHYVY